MASALVVLLLSPLSPSFWLRPVPLSLATLALALAFFFFAELAAFSFVEEVIVESEQNTQHVAPAAADERRSRPDGSCDIVAGGRCSEVYPPRRPMEEMGVIAIQSHPSLSRADGIHGGRSHPAADIGIMDSNLASPLLQRVERGRESRRRLFGRLCRLGVMLRLLTMLNALALLGAVGYSLSVHGTKELSDSSLGIEPRARTAVEYTLMTFAGLFLWCLESTTTSEEAAMRSSLGLAFGAGGRLALFLFLALCSAPAVHCDRSQLEMYISAGAVVFLVFSGLLQAWMLSCTPEYRSTVVAALETQKIKTDSTPDVFPQIYQRDEGTHLHLGVLIPGFASRDTCTM